MKIQIDKEVFVKNLNIASRFTSSRLNTAVALQGVYLVGENGFINFYSSDLHVFCHAKEKIDNMESFKVVIEYKKILEFLNLIQPGIIDIEIDERAVIITQNKTKGNFPVINAEDFPIPPNEGDDLENISASFLTKNLPFLLFTASSDEARPVLTGINFVVTDEELVMVATDGFRLSIVKDKTKAQLPSMIVPATFLRELLRVIDGQEKIGFSYIEKEKVIMFKIGDIKIYSRIIDGQFPPYEKVVPENKNTTITLNRQDLLRNTKLISIFAREFSNVVILSFSKDGLIISPKKEGNVENKTTQDIEFEGEPVRVAFNHKYLAEFLNSVETKDIIIELLRSDAPVVFKAINNTSFMHIIMPVRIQE
jgi:DNA polymerase-3 subunit beta